MYDHNAECSYEARHRSDVADKIEIEAVVERRVDCVCGTNQEKLMAIWRRTYHRLSADIAVRAWSVLDDEWLAKSLREPVTHQACDNVVTATGSIPDHQTHRPRWISLRHCEAWQHGGTCGETY